LLGFGGVGGASSSFFLTAFIALTTRQIAKAMIRKSTTVWTNTPYFVIKYSRDSAVQS
jgi:hypothetical protein